VGGRRAGIEFANLNTLKTSKGLHGGHRAGADPATPVTAAADPPAAFRSNPDGRRGEQAIAAFQEAAGADTMPRVSWGDDVVYGLEAKTARARGEALLEPTSPVSVSSGEAVAWDNKLGEAHRGETAWIIDTLEHPNAVSAGASGRRLSAARGVDVLEPAIDAAQSAQAANSIEKMLCHQMAGAHFTAMRLLEKSAADRLQPGETARLTNAAARMMDVYQAGCLTLLKLKSRGTQRVVVQYQQVNVGSGGQAVVAGRVGPGLRTRGRGGKNGQ